MPDGDCHGADQKKEHAGERVDAQPGLAERQKPWGNAGPCCVAQARAARARADEAPDAGEHAAHTHTRGHDSAQGGPRSLGDKSDGERSEQCAPGRQRQPHVDEGHRPVSPRKAATMSSGEGGQP